MKYIFNRELDQIGSHFQHLNDPATLGSRADNKSTENRMYPMDVLGSAHATDIYRSKCFSLVIQLVSTLFEVPAESLQAQTRGLAPICQARQICMYLLHTSLSISYPDIGLMFRRDRTTISHACMIVEDLRDDIGIDKNLTRLESILATIKALLGIDGPLMPGETQ